MHSDRWLTGAVAVTPLVLVLALAACGGGSTKASAPPTTSTTVAGGAFNRAALQAFTSCMQSKGVTIPTFPTRTTLPGETFPPRRNGTGTGGGNGGGGGGGGRFIGGGGGGVGSVINSSDPATKAAFQACQSKLPPGFLQQVQQGQTAFNAFRDCMQSHGVTVAANGGFGGPGGPNESTTTTTPQYAAALAICRPLLPQRGPRGGGTTTTTA